MIRIIQHEYSIEILIFHLLEENHMQNFKLDVVDVIKLALKVYKTDISKYPNLVCKIRSYNSFKVNAR